MGHTEIFRTLWAGVSHFQRCDLIFAGVSHFQRCDLIFAGVTHFPAVRPLKVLRGLASEL